MGIISPCTWRYRRTGLDRPKSGIVEQTFINVKTSDGKQNFKLFSILFYSKLSSHSGILLKWLALHAIREFLVQKKGRPISFCNSTKSYSIWAPVANCQKVMKHRMQIK
jgi:hypothetical protein